MVYRITRWPGALIVLEEVGRGVLLGYHALRVGHRQEDLRLPLLGRLEAEDRRHVPAAVAVVRCRPHGHQLALEHVLDALVDQLVRTADEVQVVDRHEVLGHVVPEQPARATWTLAPVLHVLGVGPHQVTECALVRYLAVPFDRPDLVQGDDLGTQAAVHAQHLLVDDLQEREWIIEAIQRAIVAKLIIQRQW